MSSDETEAEIIDFPKSGKKPVSSTEKIWGKDVYGHGYAGVPSILIQTQRRLGINPDANEHHHPASGLLARANAQAISDKEGPC